MSSSSITVRRWAIASSTVSPGITRMLTPAVADEAITLSAGLPSRVVIANVVRAIAAASGPAADSARVSRGRIRSARPRTGRNGRGRWGARVRIRSTVVSGSRAGIGWRSILRIARARRAVGPLRAGVEAWPPRPVDPELDAGGALLGDADRGDGALHPGERPVRDGAALVEDEPRPHATSYQLVDGGLGGRAGDLLVAAEGQPDVLRRPVAVLRGVARPPRRSRRRSPCRRGCRGPRRRRRRSRRRRPGAARAPTRRPVRRRGAPSARPDGRCSRRASGRAARGCRHGSAPAARGAGGTASGSSASSRSKASVSTREGSRSETDSMRTSACSFATAASVMAAR